MRILQVVMAFYPCKIWGGPPQNTLVLSRGLQRRGHEVHVLTSNILDYDHRMSDESLEGEWEGIPVTYLKTHWRGRRPDSLGFIWSPDLLRYRHWIQWADVIHVQDYRYFIGIGAALLAQYYRKPFVIQPRGSLPSRMGRARLKQVFDQTLGAIVLGRAAAAVALSDTEVQQLRDRAVDASRIVKVFNAFDSALCPELPDREEFRRKYGISDEERIILFLARIHQKKGLDLLLQAVATMPDINFKLCIVGPDDGYEAEARALAQSLGLSERTLFLGPIYDRDKFSAYRAADVFVLPTRGQEGLPTTLVESLYAGTPIVVTRTVEIAELIDGQAGFAVEYDKGQLASAIRELLSDPNIEQQMRTGTQKVLQEHFDLEQALNRYAALYETIVR